MISNKMKKLVENNSIIRQMFEEGKKLEKLYGKENVYDFSLGNPSIETPKKVNESIIEIIEKEETLKVHGYMNNAGFEDVRETISNHINKEFDTNFTKENIIMVCGAAAGINIILKSIINPNDEVIVFAPYFMEYNNYIENYDGKVIAISPNTENFQPNLEELEKKLSKNTKALLINTPNNPTGVIYSKDTIQKISKILNNKQKEYGHEIFLISDEPYRELVYDDNKVPYVTKYYNNTFVVYSYSKSLSLPGERIGYVIVPSQMEDSSKLINALTIANRTLGFVNAPSLMQKVIKKCIDEKVDLTSYEINKNLLYNSLTEFGFEVIRPQGAFYLFMKSPIKDDIVFCEKAKQFNILLVPGSSFGCSGYVRISYCVSTKTIKNSLQVFKKLADNFKLKG